MAGKQAVVVILDIGKTMENKINESGTTRFDIARKAVQLLVQQSLIFYRKDNLFGLVLVGTEETDNALNEDQGGYENIYVAKDLEQLDKQIVSDLESFGPTAEQGDIIDGLVVAVDMIQKKCGKKKYIKRVFIVSDGASEIHDSELPFITYFLTNKQLKTMYLIALNKPVIFFIIYLSLCKIISIS